jgi:hypothetical protein
MDAAATGETFAFVVPEAPQPTVVDLYELLQMSTNPNDSVSKLMDMASMESLGLCKFWLRSNIVQGQVWIVKSRVKLFQQRFCSCSLAIRRSNARALAKPSVFSFYFSRSPLFRSSIFIKLIKDIV